MQKTILIAAGGTGGHIFPALAVANKLQTDYQIIWLGCKNGMEQKLVKNYPINNINAVGLRGKNFKHLITAPFKILTAIIQTRKIIKQNKIDLVIGFGGFIGGLGGIGAFITRTKLFIHEQNSIAGSSNKYLNKIASKSFSAFEGVLPKSITCSNPILWQKLAKNKPSNKLNILVLGGSLGAKAINKIIPQLNLDATIYHQCGVKNYNEVKKLYDNTGKNFDNTELIPFIDDIASYYAKVDLVLCRSGAMTISELIYTKTPAILTPLPHSIDNHQFYNAKILVDNNCGFLLEQKDLNKENLTKIIRNLNKEKIKTLENNFAKFNDIDGAKIIKNYVDDLLL